MPSMKAARFHVARDIRIEDEEIPLPTADQALVAVEWCGLCASDLHEYLHGPLAVPTQPHPLSDEKLPVIMGHELARRILEAPRNSSLAPGQPVMVDPQLYCLSCATCQKGLTHGCEKWGFLGLSGRGGDLSEAVAVDTARIHPLPDSVDLSVAALLEPLAVA
ncbi:GroES-like protein [Aspergillus campestris IBT 28561]|uniref:GroES-like protein n=1 Tax=Aspergillus campestris (strain IBT 28561) TaxID=1392248 RepID=A0A2I1CRW9_ASPC2|nr:GroES-like protein [Aspergillus campestris IBT 28561]PKY00376.1 GroES-like protein [Aspergillus campestris IBT 28561]